MAGASAAMVSRAAFPSMYFSSTASCPEDVFVPEQGVAPHRGRAELSHNRHLKVGQ